MITLENVHKIYGSDTSVGPVTLDIPAHGVTALVGPNGAGKSTLLTMIGRLLKMDEGTITVGGMDVSSAKSADLATVLSILRQENHFITRLTVRQLVAFGRFPYNKGRTTVADEEIIDRYIRFFELEELEDRYLDELSGGQRQRAYVAMVLTQETEYVLLDEPLNNLDIAHSVQMMRMLRRAADEFGRTIVVVLHDLNFAAQYADCICAVKNGQVFAQGSVDEVMVDSTLSELFGTPITVIDGPRCKLACF
ncbi:MULTISPECIES: ABC transporter ATP-binding protein [Corynebacterium]|uniref:ATP-binding cassette domain-containing protein n=2 Tax=Corynebacterium glucuronolyticum TaxID=39791 RepID=A0A7T4EF52_9CORY|nr:MULTISPECIES: ATP-binding cassette domain-containing protein [Corynebacterium]EEI28500.1 ABC transporter, ATP-binding protein [Corynebacterium glucuronolyticum ATCC 51867]EEI63390.1 ABC transporter, ATP-binding protein [Corynebacterium glucuronolyticum ATCC 51866]MCT1441474.1 ATP-binding cassette domain-containing protein [Corynebacterium glucuronolyticum]MCT1563683.1 ATP-binding cassette domain-containing protein [Corynebacterium glucuronolyticum]OFO43239.1 iron ABC transporter ATP-binding